MSITWKTVAAPDLPSGNPVAAASLFQRSLENVNENMQNFSEKLKARDSERIFGDMMSGNITPDEAIQQAAQRGGASELMDLMKASRSSEMDEARIAKLQADTGYRNQQAAFLPTKQEMEIQKHGMAAEQHGSTMEQRAVNTAAARDKLNLSQQEQYNQGVAGDWDRATYQQPPEVQAKMFDELMQSHGPAVANQTQYGQALQAQQAASSKAAAAALQKGLEEQYKMDAQAGRNPGQSSGTRYSPDEWRRIELFRGPTALVANPSGGYARIPKSQLPGLPKNDQEAIAQIAADQKLLDKMNMGQSATKWFGSMNPFKWGSVSQGVLSKKLEELPAQDQQIFKKMTSLMQMTDPGTARGILNKVFDEAKGNKSEIDRVLDLQLTQFNSATKHFPIAPQNL